MNKRDAGEGTERIRHLSVLGLDRFEMKWENQSNGF